MKSSWSGCGDCESFGSRPTPGSASATRAPGPGRAQVPRPTGPFPAGGSEPSRPPLQGTGTPRPGLGAPWLPEAWGWSGLGEPALAPLRQEVAAMKPHFNSLSLLSASNTIHDHNEGGTQNASVPSGCRIRKMCLSAAQTDSGARLTGSGAKLGADRAHVREKRLPSPRCCASWAHEDLNLGPLPCQGKNDMRSTSTNAT